MNEYIFATDLGQMHDYTANAIIRRVFKRSASPGPLDIAVGAEGKVTVEHTYQLVGLFRPDLRTPYTEIVTQIKGFMESPELKGKTDLLADATGVGRPVIDMLRAVDLAPIPITIGAGLTVSPSDDGGFHVPKRDIAGAIQALFGTYRIKTAAKLDLVPVFLKEMQEFVLKQNKTTGAESFEAWRDKEHDDVVLAVGLGCWWATWTDPWRTTHNELPEDEDEGSYNPKSRVISVREERRLTGPRKRHIS